MSKEHHQSNIPITQSFDFAQDKSPNLQSFQDSPSIPNFIWEILILALAALTRFWRLDYHSIWFDEAVSLDWAQRPTGEIWSPLLSFVVDKHPPLYYLLLHGWLKILGLFGLAQSDVAIRAFGALLGVLTVWGLLQLCLRATSRSVAFLTATLTALSPLLVWYSQEVRMFQLATAGVVWLAYFLVRAWQEPAPKLRLLHWLGMIVALEVALYSYLFSAFVLPTAGITLLIWLMAQRSWRIFGEGVVALGIAGALFLPLARNAWRVGGEEAVPGVPFQDFLANHWRLLRTFTIWRVDWSQSLTTIILSLFALLLLFGIVATLRNSQFTIHHSHFTIRNLPLIWLAVPLLIANLLLAKDRTIFGEDRYLLYLVPFVLWLIAEGTVGLFNGGLWFFPFALIAIFVAALPTLWTPALARENWRAAADYILTTQRSNPNLKAAVLAHVDYTHLPLEWYLRKETTQEQLPLFFPFGGTLTPEQMDGTIIPPLQGIVDLGVDTLWLTQSHLDGVDDGHLVEGWFNQNFALVTEQYPAGVKLSGFALRSVYDQLPPLQSNAVQPNLEIVPGLTLAACEIINSELRATDETMHPPSGWVHVRLWWLATGTIADNYIASVQMVGVEGVWGDRLFRGNEALRRLPTSSWKVGDFVRDEIDVNLNPVTPAREFPIVVGVHDSADQPAGATTECGRVWIVE